MIFLNQLQYVREAVTILNNAASDYMDLTKKVQNLPVDCRRDLQRLSEIQAEAVEGLSEAQIARYFKPLTAGRDCTADYLGCFHTAPFGETLEEAAARYDGLTLETRLQKAWADNDETPILAEFTDYLTTLELEDGARWQIVSALLHPAAHKAPLFDLLHYVVEKLLRHKTELEEIFARRREELTAWERETPILQLLRDQSTYEIQAEVLPAEMTVLLFEPFVLRGRFRETGESWFAAGAFLPYFAAARLQKKLGKQDILNYGKVFADGSKLEILRLLSRRSYINRELAEALGLSAATISHHMSVLTELGLVHTAISANRILYDLNREKLNEVMDGMMAYFTTLDQQE